MPPSINHGIFFSWGLTFRYVLVNSHLIHPPSKSWLLTLGILQTYPLSESFMIDFLMPYIHRLIDQPPLNHNRQKLISCHCTSGSFQEKKTWPFLVWYFIPGPISCPGTLTHCLLDFWKIVFFKSVLNPQEKKLVVQRRIMMLLHPSRANDYEGMPEPHPQASPVSGKIYAQRIPKKNRKEALQNSEGIQQSWA